LESDALAVRATGLCEFPDNNPTGAPDRLHDNRAKPPSENPNPYYLRQRLLLGFLMGGMLPAEPTKLFNFQTIRHHLLIFGRGIIFSLTLSASQMDNISHKSSNFPLGNEITTRPQILKKTCNYNIKT
jgi:hypothetical protein